MGDVVNLRRMKKRRKLLEAAAAAKQNRMRNGRTGAEKSNDRRTEQRRQARLDALRLDVTGE
jgi:hypothetical protein